MSGIVFDIIHNVPWTGGLDEHGNVIWMQKNDVIYIIVICLEQRITWIGRNFKLSFLFFNLYFVVSSSSKFI